jgi:hypothetical protein
MAGPGDMIFVQRNERVVRNGKLAWRIKERPEFEGQKDTGRSRGAGIWRVAVGGKR